MIAIPVIMIGSLVVINNHRVKEIKNRIRVDIDKFLEDRKCVKKPMIAIVGPPGVGKSTVAHAINDSIEFSKPLITKVEFYRMRQKFRDDELVIHDFDSQVQNKSITSGLNHGTMEDEKLEGKLLFVTDTRGSDEMDIDHTKYDLIITCLSFGKRFKVSGKSKIILFTQHNDSVFRNKEYVVWVSRVLLETFNYEWDGYFKTIKLKDGRIISFVDFLKTPVQALCDAIGDDLTWGTTIKGIQKRQMIWPAECINEIKLSLLDSEPKALLRWVMSKVELYAKGDVYDDLYCVVGHRTIKLTKTLMNDEDYNESLRRLKGELALLLENE